MVFLILTLYLIFRTSTVQTYFSKKIANYLSKELKTEIAIGGVDITYFLNIVLEDFSVKDKHKNILLYSKSIKIKIDRISPTFKILNLENIKLKDTRINLKEYKTDSTFNYQFLVDYFSSKKKDITKTKRWAIKCKNLEFENNTLVYQIEKKLDTTTTTSCKLIDFNDIELNKLNINISNIIC